MEVYVLYGRQNSFEGVYDWDGNYFGELQISDVFADFGTAEQEFRKAVINAFNEEAETGYFCDVSDMKNKQDDEIFNDFNPEDACGEVFWEYRKDEKKKELSWQMYYIGDEETSPILPGFYVVPKTIK